MQSRAKLIQPGMKLTAINPEKIARLDSHELIYLHDRLHELYELGVKLDDQEVCHRAEQAHRRYVYEMLQRSISHPYIDEMDSSVHVTEAAETEDDTESTDAEPNSDSVMLAFEIPAEIGAKIAQQGGEAAEELHMTLAYLGHAKDWDDNQLQQLPGIVSVYATNSKPLAGQISGMGRFAGSPSSDSMDVLYNSVDVPDLPAWRQGLIDWLDDAGFAVNSDHGFTPHITIKYLSTEEPAEIGAQEIIPIDFTEMMCKIGSKIYRLPLSSQQAMRPRKWADRLAAAQEKLHESSASMSARAGRRNLQIVDPRNELRNGSGGSDLAVPETEAEALNQDEIAGLYLQEAENQQQVIYGVLLVPDEPDLDGDCFSAELVQKACQDYSTKLEADEQHKFANPNLEVADSFIAPEGYQINGHPVKPGSWVVGIRSADQAVVDKVKSGDYRGLSIEGTAVVRERKKSPQLLQ